ncbi:hypothetical protein [Phenylobacterium sp.]|jgi:hypothetical protein|uniref:hypothetical protein n=1 Tax=Phenylobacterium sp. TaxID=1871053 RepID=UPI002F937396
MPGTSFDSDSDFDPQDQAEVFDESNTVGGEGAAAMGGDSPLGVGEDMRTFEELPDVVDMMQKVGDRDDDEALALDADEFDEDAVDDGDLEDDDELSYRAVDEEDEDDLDGLGAEAGSDFIDEAAIDPEEIEGLHEVRDADAVSGGEDDFTNFQSKNVSDEDLKRMGYSEDRGGETRAKPDED